MMAYDSEIDGGRATPYTYVNARAGAGSCAGFSNPTPHCHPEYFGAQRRNVSKDCQWVPTNTRHGSNTLQNGTQYQTHNSSFITHNSEENVIGRFLSPDPVLQDPSNAQNYNKYSYVLNNPLKFTDPSGYRGQRVYRLQAPDMLAENRKLNMDREAAWQKMKGQESGDGFFALLSVLYGGGTGGGGGDMFGSNPKTSTPTCEDAGSGETTDVDEGDPKDSPNTYNIYDLARAFTSVTDRIKWVSLFNSMYKNGYTYLNDNIFNGFSTSWEDYLLEMGMSLRSWMYAFISFERTIEGYYFTNEYETKGKNMGVFIKQREIPTFPGLPPAIVTDVYWGYNGAFWYTYTGIIHY